MVKLNLLSDNLVLVLKEILNNQDVVKYLHYDQRDPLSQPDLTLPANDLMFKKVFPYPFDPTVEKDESSQIRVWYPNGRFQTKEIVTGTSIYVDIVVAKSLWLVNDGESKIRPYEIMRLLTNHFSDTSIGTLGILNFDKFSHLRVNDKFDALRLEVKMTTIGTE